MLWMPSPFDRLTASLTGSPEKLPCPRPLPCLRAPGVFGGMERWCTRGIGQFFNLIGLWEE